MRRNWFFAGLVIFAAGAAYAATEQRTENFDDAPGWHGNANLVAPQNFGYRSSNNAGGAAAGEGGGLNERTPDSWYADQFLGTLNLATDDLSVTMRVNHASSCNAGFGYFNIASYNGTGGGLDGVEMLGFRVDGNDIYLEANGRSGPTSLPIGTAATVTFGYNATTQQASLAVNGGTPITSNINLGSLTFDRFGMLALGESSGSGGNFFFDDVTYTVGAPGVVTVDSGGGGDYLTIDAAAGDFSSYAVGGQGVIEVTDSGINDTAGPSLPSGNLTIRAAAGDSPIIRIGNGGRAASVHNAGRFTFQGLTFIGPDTGAAEYVFRSDPAPGLNITINFEDCVATQNNGSGGARTDWSGAGTANGLGQIGRAFQLNNDGGEPHINVSNSVLGFMQERAISFSRAGGNPSVGSHVTLTHSLIVESKEQSLFLEAIQPALTITLNESAILDCNNTPIYIAGGAPDANFSLVLRDSIVYGLANERLIFGSGGFAGALTMERCTLFNTVNERYILMNENETGAGLTSLTMVDCIFYGTSNGDAAITIRDSGGNAIDPAVSGSLTISNIAVQSGNGAQSDQAAALIAAFDAVYGGTGPMSDDPLFVAGTTAAIAADLDGARSWDRTTNDLFDVNNPEYKERGTPGVRPYWFDPDGGNLTGGADPTEIVPVELGTFTLD